MARRHPAYRGTREASPREKKSDDFMDWTKASPESSGASKSDVASSISSGPPAGPATSAGGAFSIPSGGGSGFGKSLFLLIIAAFGLFLIFSKGSDGKPRIMGVLAAFQGAGQIGTKIPVAPKPVVKGTKVKA